MIRSNRLAKLHIFRGAAISSKSTLKTCVVKSTMKSDFIILEKAATEADWLQKADWLHTTTME